MGREVRHIPADWAHPTNMRGFYVPLYGRPYSKDAMAYTVDKAMWDMGYRRSYFIGDETMWKLLEQEHWGTAFDDWDGPEPDRADYMPTWPEAERTHIQMYETCSEGTPVSPVMETPDELAHWLADNGASAFGHSTATYEGWLATIKQGWAIGMVFDAERGMRSGVEYSAEKEPK